jgi:DNA-binding response OmpR family regulator
VSPTILLLAAPAETEEVARILTDRSGVRLRRLPDLDETLDPADQLAAERPDAVILGTGTLGLDVIAYVEAARQNHPACLILVLCDPDLAQRMGRLNAHAVLSRPVRPQRLLAELAPILPRPSAGSVIIDPSLYAPASPSMRTTAVSAELLLRVDDMLADPLSPLLSEPPIPRERENEAPRRGSTVSGEFEQILGARPRAETQSPPRPEPAPGPKVAVDASLLLEARPQPPPPPPEATRRTTQPPLIPGAPVAPTTPAAPLTPTAPPASTTPTAPRRPSGSMATPPPLPSEAASRRSASRQLPVVPAAPPGTPPLEGDLQTMDPPMLVGWLCTTGYTGCLRLQRDPPDGSQRLLYLDGGELVAAASTISVDSLAELLYHEGRLSREQLKRARQVLSRAGESSNRRLAQLLCDEHLMPRADITPLLRRHLIEIFYRCLAWERGRYQLSPRGAPLEDRVHLKENPRLLLLEGLRRKASLDSLIARIGPENTVLQPAGSGGLILRDAGVTAFEQRALPLFDGQNTLLQISQRSGLAEHATYVLAYALICLGGLRRPAPGKAAGLLPDPAVEEAIARVRGKHQQVLEGDYFAMLDLPVEADAAQVAQAYEALQGAFSAARLPPACRAELSTEIAQIAAVLKEAHAVLSSDEMRAAYRNHLAPLSSPPSGAENLS